MPRRGCRSAARTALVAVVALAVLASRAHSAFTCVVGDDAVQCAALGDLYAVTNGAGWQSNNGWSAAAAGQPTSYCAFEGVACGAGGAVTYLCVRLPRAAACTVARQLLR